MTPCSACGGPYHPASGHVWTVTCVLCGPCTRSFTAFVKDQMHRSPHRKGHVQRPSPGVRVL